MQEMAKKRFRIDLSRFKLHTCLREAAELTLHFNSASRKFYLSLIALLVIEMKKQGKIYSIPLAKHLELLALLNETVGESVGASTRESLMPRIYRKWKSALPDIENAPLFKIVGRNKYYDDNAAKTYRFSETEKDSWANLFEYKGSEENIRLRFSIDTLGAGLDDIIVTYGEKTDAKAWENYVNDLKKEQDIREAPAGTAENSEIGFGDKKSSEVNWRSLALAAIGVIIVAAVGLVSWNYYLRQTQRVDPPSLEKMAFPLPDKPSIAVLPFVNVTADPDQEYFCDGLTDQLINTLSKLRNLFVIARNSTFVYKGKPVKIQKVAEDLGVQYILEGSVQRDPDRVRVTTQLVDAITGLHKWSERYDRNIEDIFAIQDDITINITRALQVELIEGEQTRNYGKWGGTNLRAFEKRLQGREYVLKGSKEDNTRAREYYEEAIALDPSYAGVYALLGWTHFWDARFGWSESPGQSIKIAQELAQKSLALNDDIDYAHTLLGSIYLIQRKYEKSIAEGELALAICPNGAHNHAYMAGLLGNLGRWEESIEVAKKSIRLSPFPPVAYLHWLGRAYFMTEQYDDAIATWKKALNLNPDYLHAHIFLSACYSSSGRPAEAAIAAEKVLQVNPNFSLKSYKKILLYKNKADKERLISALREAGLK